MMSVWDAYQERSQELEERLEAPSASVFCPLKAIPEGEKHINGRK
jgi:hypothetical protein